MLPAVLALVLPVASAGAATTKSISDPAGDVVSTPIDGYTAMGPPAWADLLSATFTVSKGDNLTITLQTADLPDANSAAGMWGVVGTVTLPDGRDKSLHAWVASTGVHSATVGSRSCRASGAFSAATNLVVLKINFTSCVPGRAVVRLRGEGAVKGSKTSGEDTYYQNVYVDSTASKNVRLT